MDPLIALAIFGAYFVIDIVYTSFVRYVGNGSAVKAATCSVFIYLLMAFGIGETIENRWYLLPLAAGAWLGTFIALKWFKDDSSKP